MQNETFKNVNNISKYLFQNVTGLGNKDKDFWNYIVVADFISLSETWVESKNWEFNKNNLSCLFNWESFHAKRENIKGRAKGSFLLDVKKSQGKENC